MTLGGSYQDHHLEMFSDMLLDQLQKQGSSLEQTVTVQPMSGQKEHFDKVGAMTSYTKTQRAQTKTYQDATFERRDVSFQFNSADIILDKVDILDMVTNPENDFVRNMVFALGRQKDEVIFSAMTGNAVVVANGSSTNTALPTASKIDVNDHTFDPVGGTNNIGLTEFKLKNAISKLRAARVDVSREQIFCIAPSNQITGLTTVVQMVSRDYRNTDPLPLVAGPMVDQNLSGFLGITFIAYEETGNINTTDQVAYVFVKSAIKLGVRQPLTVERLQDPSRVGNPWTLSATEDLGAVRMYEEKVIQIACNPTVFKSA